MPRMLRRAAVLGTTAHVASKAGAAKAQAASAQQAPPPPAPAPAAEAADPYAELKQAKELLDQGILTQAEFDTQKQKILGGM